MCHAGINTDFLERCIQSLETAFEQLQLQEKDSVLYEIYRAACVKQFELVLEQCGNLLKRRLCPYFASNREADRLTFRDRFRHAARHGLISVESCERWFEYRDNRNDTAHNYEENFAETTLSLLPTFVADAKGLAQVIAEDRDD